MKHLSELLPSISPTAAPSTANPNTQAAGLTVEVGSKMTRLERSRQAGLADMEMVARLGNRLLSKSLWPTTPSAEDVKNRLVLLEETTTLPSYEDAVVLIGRFASHFPRRDEHERAVMIGEMANACERNEITLMGLSVSLTEMLEEATGENPFMPPTGEILRRALLKSIAFRACLQNDRTRLTNQTKGE